MNILLSVIYCQVLNLFPYKSYIKLDKISMVKIPKHFLIKGYIEKYKGCYIAKEFTLIKPMRYVGLYENDIERGGNILIFDGDFKTINDKVWIPDFSAESYGLLTGGLILSLLFRLFLN